MTEVDFWSGEVQERSRVYDSAKQMNKLGWLNPGDAVHVIELYPDGPDPQWARFDDYAPAGVDEVEPWREDTQNEWWVAVDAFYGGGDEQDDDAGDEEDEGGVTDAELAAALRTLRDFFLG